MPDKASKSVSVRKETNIQLRKYTLEKIETKKPLSMAFS